MQIVLFLRDIHIMYKRETLNLYDSIYLFSCFQCSAASLYSVYSTCCSQGLWCVGICFVPWRGGEITLKRTLFVQRRTLYCDFKVHFFNSCPYSCYIYIRYTGFSVFHFRMHFCCFVTRQRYSVAVLISEHRSLGVHNFLLVSCPGYGESRCCVVVVVVLISKIGKVWMCRVCVCVYDINVTCVYVCEDGHLGVMLRPCICRDLFCWSTLQGWNV